MKSSQLYSLPQYSAGKDPFVYYSYRSPVTRRMQRFKLKKGFDKTKPATWEAHANALIEEWSKKLKGGFDPFTEQTKAIVTDTDSLTHYIDEVLEKKKWRKKNTKRTYLKAVTHFKAWMLAAHKYDEPPWRFTEDDANEFLDWLENKKHLSPTTRNNHRGWMGTIMALVKTQLRKKKITIENIFLLTKKIPEDRKGRTPFNLKQVKRLEKYILPRDPELWLACLMVRYTMVRTTQELPRLKLSDFDTEKMKLTVQGEIAKNNRTQSVDVHPDIFSHMKKRGYFDFPIDHYIFSKERAPGAKPYSENTLTNRFSDIRDKLKFSKDYSLYSFKHTGNAELHDRHTALPKIRDQNRHSDIRTTDIYSKRHGFYNEENVWAGS